MLGDMLELGDFTEEAHRQLGERVEELSIDLLLTMGEKVGKLSIDFLIALGNEAPILVESAIRHGLPRERASVAESHAEAISFLEEVIQKGDWILVKGSRKMAMEKIVEGLIERRA